MPPLKRASLCDTTFVVAAAALHCEIERARMKEEEEDANTIRASSQLLANAPPLRSTGFTGFRLFNFGRRAYKLAD